VDELEQCGEATFLECLRAGDVVQRIADGRKVKERERLQVEEHAGSFVEEIFAPFGHAPLAALGGLAAFAFGLSFAYAVYAKATTDPFPAKARALSRFLRNAFYFDSIYGFLISITHEMLARLADWLDRWLIAGLGVRGIHGTVEILGRGLRLVQTGSLQTYAFLFAIGVAVVLFLALR
jgi:NADH-quinone oxidoreductase subunit L